MNIKSEHTAAVVIFLMLACALLLNDRATPAVHAEVKPPAGKVVAYYLHGTIRCVACLDIERNARETVFDMFLSEMRAGAVEWRAVNFDVPEYRHFEKDYALPHPSLVLVREQAGQRTDHKILGECWNLTEDPQALQQYVARELAQFMAEGAQAD